MGRQAWLRQNHLEALENRLNRKIGAFAVVQCLVILDTNLLKM